MLSAVKHVCLFILVVNQLDAQNFVLQQVYFMPLHALSTYIHHQEVKIVSYRLWYHHTYRWLSHAQVERGPMHGTATYTCDDTRGCIIQF